MTRFKKNQIPPAGTVEYGYISISFFGDDKEELVNTLNGAGLPYTSLAHFIRAAINAKLEHHGLDFQVTER